MADVVTRFKIETTQFDSKLRDTAKALQGIARQASLGGKDFNGFGQKSIEAARALGTVASGATNTKDKLKDLVGSYNDAAKAYNSLTDEAKKGEFGQALSASLQKLQRDIKETKEDLYGLGDASRVKGGGGGLFSGMGDKMSGAIQVFAGNMMTKAAGAVAELGSEIFASVQQGIELARQGEGIRIAFERLGRGDILDGLRQATHGTVTDLELMKAAVKFNDFKLPLDELGTMLAFAQQKAKDTGQSVDYMVDSIVTGLGRKSLMILDNLGLSANEVKEKMKETGDMTKAVGEIIREQMSKAGDYVETAADRATQADVNLKNAMEELGRTFQPLSDAGASLWSSLKIGALDLLNSAVRPLIDALTEAGRIRSQFAKQGGDERVNRMLGRLSGISNSQYRKNTYNAQLGNFNTKIDSYQQYLTDYMKWQGDKTAVGAYDRMQSFQKQTGLSLYSDVKEQLEVFKRMRSEYVQGAKIILNDNPSPSPADTTITKPTKTKSGKTETIKTEEQLNNEEVQKLTQEYIKASDDRRKAIEGEIKTLQDRNAEIKRLMEAAQGKVTPDGSLKALSEDLSKLQQERQLLSDPIDIELHDQAIKDVQDEIDRLNGKKVEVELVVDNRTPFEKLRDSLKIEIAEENMQVDTTTLQTLMKTAIQNGIDGLDPQFASLQDKMREGMNIPDSTWEDLQTQINEKLKEIDIEPIKIDFKTGTIAKDGKDVAKEWNSAANAISSVGSAMQSIEDPSAKIVGTIAQAIATIALTYAQSLKGTFTPWDWIAAAASGMATMMSVISAIHSSTGYAEGGIIKGNSYSGDNIMANGGAIGLNAGELVLNKAQQSTLASEIQNGGNRIQVIGRLSGEQLFLCAENWAKRTGKGEFVTW